ncbi:MAG: hypothetical protein N2050_03075 [Flavobacteriales bacterium]|nr:hypothetical protein [Flavobacteriales bacterium]MCX7649523.1 hypothetical protein [Flavobacteriales bacterium]MDW8431236.1 hypothetical protein [Flavobacteriales bacterium]
MKKYFLFTISTAIAYSLSAQRIKVESGDLSFLKNVKSFKVSYDFSGMKVGKKTEDEYLNEKAAKYDKDEPGRGGKFKESWFRDRETRFYPKFEELFNDHGRKAGFSVSRTEGATDMVVHTTFTEPGYNVGVSRMNASINLMVHFKQNGKELATISVTGAPGQTFGGYDFDTGVRIAEAYAKAGKELAGFLSKQAK